MYHFIEIFEHRFRNESVIRHDEKNLNIFYKSFRKTVKLHLDFSLHLILKNDLGCVCVCLSVDDGERGGFVEFKRKKTT